MNHSLMSMNPDGSMGRIDMKRKVNRVGSNSMYGVDLFEPK